MLLDLIEAEELEGDWDIWPGIFADDS